MATIDTLQDAVNTLTSSTTSLLNEVSTSKTYLDAAEAGAEDARDTALTHKTGAETAKTGAEAARDLAYSYQQSAASAVAYQDLAAIAASKTDTAVDVFVYDTRKDSDGGAWRKRCQHTSWYNETLNTSTRGSRKEFPAVAVIVAEASQVTIYDGDDPSLPMWMVFNARNKMLYPDSITSVVMLNGVLSVGGNDSSYYGFIDLNFISEFANLRTKTTRYENSAPIASRESAFPYKNVGNAGTIVNVYINDVAMTVLPNAPIDDATGLPIPTIAVATDGGVSVIKDDGSVVDLTHTVSANNESNSVAFTETNGIAWSSRVNWNVYGYYLQVLFEIPSSDYSGSPDLFFTGIANTASSDFKLVTPATNSGGVVSALIGEKHIGGGSGLTLFDRDNSNSANSLVSYITSSYNTGWMNGDIKLATLSDTDDADVTGAELVTNGTFDTDTSGWTAIDATLSVDSGRFKVEQPTNASAYGHQVVTTEVGKTYTVSADFISTGSNGRLVVGTNYYNGVYGATPYLSTTRTEIVTFVATTTTTYITIHSYAGAGAYQLADNITCRLIEEDRSVNGNGLQVFGTVTKNPVATGADLVGYGGFGAGIKFVQPHNSDFEFGTNDFAISFWFKNTTSGTQQFFRIGEDGSDSGVVESYYISTGEIRFVLKETTSGAAYLLNSGTTYLDGTWHHAVMGVSNSKRILYVDGKPISTTGSIPAGGVTNTSSVLNIGQTGSDGNYLSTGSIALFRISATAPSAEQIAKIYEDEKVLFQENAKATLYGSSDAVTALAYDDDTNLLHVGTSSGRSDFNGLRRVNNTTDAVTEAISASNGLIAED